MREKMVSTRIPEEVYEIIVGSGRSMYMFAREAILEKYMRDITGVGKIKALEKQIETIEKELEGLRRQLVDAKKEYNKTKEKALRNIRAAPHTAEFWSRVLGVDADELRREAGV